MIWKGSGRQFEGSRDPGTLASPCCGPHFLHGHREVSKSTGERLSSRMQKRLDSRVGPAFQRQAHQLCAFLFIPQTTAAALSGCKEPDRQHSSLCSWTSTSCVVCLTKCPAVPCHRSSLLSPLGGSTCCVPPRVSSHYSVPSGSDLDLLTHGFSHPHRFSFGPHKPFIRLFIHSYNSFY